ncbi:MAG: hypothetical protein ACRYFW_07310 [Janthinobacterium lividum]
MEPQGAGGEHAPSLDLGQHMVLGSTEPPWAEAPWPGDAAEPTGLSGSIMPLVAGLGTVAWIGIALWLAHDALVRMDGAALVEFAAALAAVPALVGIGWLLLRRNSTAEARRFGQTAAAMRSEAASLERTVATLAAAIDTSRIKLAEQADAMAAIGAGAADRLAAVGRGFADEIAEANTHSASLASATGEAQARLGMLIATLPRARAEIVDAGEQLDRIGADTGAQVAALDAQVVALATRAQAAEDIADGAARRLADHLERMEATSETAGARLEAVTASTAASVDALLGRTADAVETSRRGIEAQGDTMLTIVEAHQQTLDAAARDSAEALATRIEVIELVIERIAHRLDAQRAAGDDLVGGLEDGIARVGDRLDRLHAQGVDRSQHLAASISALGGSADAMTEALQAGDTMAGRAIGTAETLLTALDAATREIDETLPDALERLDARIGASQRIVAQSKPELLALVTAAESTQDAIEAIAQVIAGQRATVDQLSGTLLDTLTSGRSKADALGQVVDESVARANRFADEAAPRLVDALLRVRDTATAAADKARETIAAVIPQAVDRLETEAAAALGRATGGSVERQVAAVAAAADGAVLAAAKATERLAERVREIDDATALIETRLEDARAEREEADRDHFSRRVSLLIEALNSASIDITRSFAPEVSDSAWAAYLKGDRGVFTRRAVRLLEPGDARDIARLYDTQAPFRDQVNRYIHDFEAMLRTILAQRDGSPLGVTLLSSDMGKLYVALAQAIERLR